MNIGTGFTWEIKGDKLLVEVDLKHRGELSNSGSTIAVATSGGGMKLGHKDITMNLSVYTKEGLDKARLEKAKAMGYKTWMEYEAAKKATPAA
jgi:hypothetical protein